MVRVLWALLCLVGGEAGKAKVSVASGGGSKLPFGLSPVVDKDWDLLKGTVSVGGNYALADSAFTPKAVHVKAQRPGGARAGAAARLGREVGGPPEREGLTRGAIDPQGEAGGLGGGKGGERDGAVGGDASDRGRWGGGRRRSLGLRPWRRGRRLAG